MKRRALFFTLIALCIGFEADGKTHPHDDSLGWLLKNDSEAIAYCKRDTNAFIAITWPIAQGKDIQIERILEAYGTLWYKKTMTLSPEQALTLLNKAHPQISNMYDHLDWYFPKKDTFKKPARIYVITFKDVATAVSCKYAIRRLFKLQYRPIHINDTHKETVELADHLFEA